MVRLDFLCAIFKCILLVCLVNGQKTEKPKPTSDPEIEVVYLKVVSTIQARFATTLVNSMVANRGKAAKELTFTAQLPDAAFISNFSMQIDDKIIYGNVKEKDEAKADFEAAKSRGESTGLVAQAPRETNSFTISVNVAAQSKVKFNLTYQEILKRVHGVYKQIINLQPQQPVSDLQVDVYITERGDIKQVKVPKFGEKVGEKTNKELLIMENEPNAVIDPVVQEDKAHTVHIHYQPKQKTKDEVYNGQLVVLYDVKRDQTAGDIEVVNGYFVHFFAPDNLPKGSKNIVFVLDKSGSMAGRKLEQLKDAMKLILNDLNPDDRFYIVFFADEVELWRKEATLATPDNIKAAVQYVQDTEIAGGTNIYDSLQKGISILKSEQASKALVSMVLFLTDGEPTTGVTDLSKIINDTTDANNAQKKFIIHGLAFGDNSDYKLLQKISARNSGLARKIYEDSDASLQLSGFYAEISAPILTELKIDYLNETVDASSIVRDDTHNYYDGSEIVIIGKVNDKKAIDDKAAFEAKVSGESASGKVNLVSHSHPVIMCRQPFDLVSDGIPPGAVAPRSIWCCPPPVCCFGPRCPPWPTAPPPREPLPATTAGGFVERMWAYQTIQKMLKQADLAEKESEGKDLKKKALDLSLKYHFVTKLTSMVVVKPNEKNATTLKEETKQSPNNQGGGLSSASFSGFAAAGPLGAPGGAGFGGLPAKSGRPFPHALPPPPPPAPAPASANSGATSTSGLPNPHPPPAPAPAPEKGEEPPPPATQTPVFPTSQVATSPAPACQMILVVVRDSNVSIANDALRSNFDDAVIKQLSTYSSISAKAAYVKVLPDRARAYVDRDLNSLQGVRQGGPKVNELAVNTTLSEVMNNLLSPYSSSKSAKLYVLYMDAGQSVQHAVRESDSWRKLGATVYAASVKNDNSAAFQQELRSIAQDQARVYSVQASSGADLGKAISKC